jgi:hypothetical protein
MVKNKARTQGGLKSLKDIILNYNIDNAGKYVSKEFQDYGYRLALELDDLKRVSLYMKISKEYDRSLIETARNFIKDAKDVKSKSRLFMWKLTQLRKGKGK